MDHYLQQLKYYCILSVVPCVFGKALANNRLPCLFVAAGMCVTEPLPSNGHVCHIIVRHI
jgi:hypothetical protein